MDIQEIKKARAKLNSELLHALLSFEREAGLCVTSIELIREHAVGLEKRLIIVETTVELPGM